MSQETSTTTTTASPAARTAGAPQSTGVPAVQRQMVNFAFYKLDPAFRRLPKGERQDALAEFAALLERWSESPDLILRTYSLVGLRADCDFMLWRISNDLGCFQAMQAEMDDLRLN